MYTSIKNQYSVKSKGISLGNLVRKKRAHIIQDTILKPISINYNKF